MKLYLQECYYVIGFTGCSVRTDYIGSWCCFIHVQVYHQNTYRMSYLIPQYHMVWDGTLGFQGTSGDKSGQHQLFQLACECKHPEVVNRIHPDLQHMYFIAQDTADERQCVSSINFKQDKEMRSHCLETLDIQTLSNHLVFCIVIHEHHLSSSGSLVFSKSLHMDSVLSSIPCVKANRYFISYSHGHLDYISKERDITEECPVLSSPTLIWFTLHLL